MKNRSKEPLWPEWSLARVRELAASRKGKGVRLKVKKSLPCIHVGEKLTMNEIRAAGLKETRRWHRCEIGLTANKAGVPGVACSCEGCNSKCEGYKSE